MVNHTTIKKTPAQQKKLSKKTMPGTKRSVRAVTKKESAKKKACERFETKLRDKDDSGFYASLKVVATDNDYTVKQKYFIFKFKDSEHFEYIRDDCFNLIHDPIDMLFHREKLYGMSIDYIRFSCEYEVNIPVKIDMDLASKCYIGTCTGCIADEKCIGNSEDPIYAEFEVTIRLDPEQTELVDTATVKFKSLDEFEQNKKDNFATVLLVVTRDAAVRNPTASIFDACYADTILLDPSKYEDTEDLWLITDLELDFTKDVI